MALWNRLHPGTDALLILAVITAMLIADAIVGGFANEHLAIVVAILVPLAEGLRRRYGDAGEAC